MTPFAFDTLSASKRLREAGMEEGVAEAVVSVFQHAAETVDIGHLATKDDVNTLRGDLEALRVSTKADFGLLKAEVDGIRAEMATKTDLGVLKNELSADLKIMAADLRAEFNDKFRQQNWTMLGGMAVLIAITTGAAKLVG